MMNESTEFQQLIEKSELAIIADHACMHIRHESVWEEKYDHENIDDTSLNTTKRLDAE